MHIPIPSLADAFWKVFPNIITWRTFEAFTLPEQAEGLAGLGWGVLFWQAAANSRSLELKSGCWGALFALDLLTLSPLRRGSSTPPWLVSLPTRSFLRQSPFSCACNQKGRCTPSCLPAGLFLLKIGTISVLLWLSLSLSRIRRPFTSIWLHEPPWLFLRPVPSMRSHLLFLALSNEQDRRLLGPFRPLFTWRW
jgi:hypothetical protein